VDGAPFGADRSGACWLGGIAMRITRLLLGATALLAVAAPAIGADDPAGSQAAATSGDAAAQDVPPVEMEKPAAGRTVSMGPAVKDAQGNEGRVHTVVSGDTLWDISEAYLGSPFSWPSVWKSNPAVKNPHRIYPGNQIWISATEMRPITPEESAALTPATPAAMDDAVAKPVGAFPVPQMESIGLVSAEEIEGAGALLGSPEGEKWLSAFRRAYVSMGEGQVQSGDRFTIVRETQRVRDPESGDTIGVHVLKLGWLEITSVGVESSEAMIRASSGEIQRGDRLIQRVEPAFEVPVRAGAADVEGQIALLPNERTTTGQRDIVFLNRGTDHGVDIGSTLEVYRPGAVVKDRETRVRHQLPDEVIGNMIVVSARPESAVAIVTHSTLEFARGEHFRSADLTSSYRPSIAPADATQWTARTIEGRNEGLPAKVAPASASK
jgi:hypothetical protein